jgi:hypothetical protein
MMHLQHLYVPYCMACGNSITAPAPDAATEATSLLPRVTPIIHRCSGRMTILKKQDNTTSFVEQLGKCNATYCDACFRAANRQFGGFRCVVPICDRSNTLDVDSAITQLLQENQAGWLTHDPDARWYQNQISAAVTRAFAGRKGRRGAYSGIMNVEAPNAQSLMAPWVTLGSFQQGVGRDVLRYFIQVLLAFHAIRGDADALDKTFGPESGAGKVQVLGRLLEDMLDNPGKPELYGKLMAWHRYLQRHSPDAFNATMSTVAEMVEKLTPEDADHPLQHLGNGDRDWNNNQHLYRVIARIFNTKEKRGAEGYNRQAKLGMQDIKPFSRCGDFTRVFVILCLIIIPIIALCPEIFSDIAAQAVEPTKVPCEGPFCPEPGPRVLSTDHASGFAHLVNGIGNAGAIVLVVAYCIFAIFIILRILWLRLK